MAVFVDLLIMNGDLVLDAGRNPLLTTDSACIAQDITHMILESGLAKELVAERSETIISDVERQLILLAESDERIIPGSGKIEHGEKQRILSVSSYEFGDVTLWI